MKIIATPIEIKSFTAPLSSRFGKANYYAFFDGHEIVIGKNPAHNGMKVATWLVERGVHHLLLKEQNRKPCALKVKHDISLHYPSTVHPTVNYPALNGRAS